MLPMSEVGGQSTFENSTYIARKCKRLEQHHGGRGVMEGVWLNPHGDGQCGFRALAAFMGVHGQPCRAMVKELKSGSFTDAEAVTMFMASDLQSSCPVEAWMSSRHLELLCRAGVGPLKHGVLVKYFGNFSGLEYQYFGPEGQEALDGPDALRLKAGRPQMCLLGFRRQHFCLLRDFFATPEDVAVQNGDAAGAGGGL